MYQSKLLKQFAFSMACAAGLVCGTAAAATIPVGTTYSFDLTSTANQSLGAGTLANVKLTQTSATKVDVLVTLASSTYSYAGTGVGPSFVFSLMPEFGSSLVTLTGSSLSSGMFNVLPYVARVTDPDNSTDYNLTPDGIFTNAIALSSNGSSAKYGAPLTFSITNTGAQGISLASFTTSYERNNGQQGGYAFVLDMLNGTRTGSAAFLGLKPTSITIPTTTGNNGEQNVPEPASLALMGLGMLAFAARRKQK